MIQKRTGLRLSTGASKSIFVPAPPFYREAPSGEVSVDEFANLARDRMNALREMDKVCGWENSSGLGGAVFALEENEARVEASLTRFNHLLPSREDSISHNILRLAMCKSSDTKTWLVRNEERLFMFRLSRFQKLGEPAEIQAFLQSSGVISKKAKIIDLSTDERELYNELVSVTPGTERGSVFYGLPFATVPPHVISRRQVIVRRGIAYLPAPELRFVAARQFRQHLEHQMTLAPQCAAMVERDARLGPLLQEMSSLSWSGPAAPTEVSDSERLSLSNWQMVAPRSFPPCMQVLADHMFNKRKHLKYKGRTQMQPFLKSAGFTLDESKAWWKQGMTRDPTVDAGKFDKEYVYGINYTYGKVGNMKEKTCLKCQTIIQQPFPSGEEMHGCPFRHADTEGLMQMLRGWGVDEKALFEIKTKVSEHHYELACRDLFKARHPGNDGEEMGNHPLQFYQESMRYHGAKDETKAKLELKGESPVKKEPESAPVAAALPVPVA